MIVKVIRLVEEVYYVMSEDVDDAVDSVVRRLATPNVAKVLDIKASRVEHIEGEK